MNYVDKILEEVNNYDIVLIGLNRESREKLEEIGYKYYFEKELPLLYEVKMEKMILNGNEYLEDYLLRNGYKLIERVKENE